MSFPARRAADRVSFGSRRPFGRAQPRRHQGYDRRIEGHPDSGGDAREERFAKNEILFRAVNEAILQQALRFGGEKDGLAGLLADFADPRDATTPSDFDT